MANTGRTVIQHSRVYVGGVDMSGYTRSYGPLVHEFDEADLTTLTDACKGRLPAMANVSMGTLNGVFDNDAAGMYNKLSSPGSAKVLTIPMGIRAAPTAGVPCWCGQFIELGYQAHEDGGAMVCSIPFGGWDAAGLINYNLPWGWLLHASATETGANTGNGVDNPQSNHSHAGGYLIYQIASITGAGTVVLSVDDSASVDSAFGALSGATTAAISNAAAPCAGIIALATNADIKRFLRWQIALTGSTDCTFVMAFVRMPHP